MSKKILVVVDIQNLFLSSRELYGPLARIDYVKLKEIFSPKEESIVVDKIAYVLSSPYHDGRNFIRFLKKQGYMVFNKVAQLSKNQQNNHIHTVKQRSWSENMVWETMKLLPVYDELYIISGNGGFCPVVKKAKLDGKLTTVISFRSSLQTQLASEADAVIYLTKEYLYDSSSFKKEPELLLD